MTNLRVHVANLTILAFCSRKQRHGLGQEEQVRGRLSHRLTALTPPHPPSAEMSGEMKNWAKRSSAASRWDQFTSN